jgi:hypothetical protein
MSSTLDQRPTIDRRIAARRQTVREAGARRRLRWLLMLLGLAGGGALVAWLLFQSSFLAVSEISISGQARSTADTIVADLGVVPGTPTVNVPAAELEVALLADPWIAAADVSVRWPGSVEVIVVEYVPAAWVRAGDQWLLAAKDGAVLDVASTIPDNAPHVEVGTVAGGAGAVIAEIEAVGAIEFLNQLPASLAVGASVTGDVDGLRAVVSGFVIDLGYPVDMTEKAAALTVLLGAETVPVGSVISVVSPSRPAVLEPEPAGTAIDVDADPADGATPATSEGDENGDADAQNGSTEP